MRLPLLLVALSLAAACGDDLVRAQDDRATTDGGRTDVTTPDGGRIDPPITEPEPGDDGRLGPPYPIVLVHGFMGAKWYGPVDYWWRIPRVLESQGRRVFVADTPSIQAPEVRAGVLAKLVDDVLAQTHARKVVLIGHSMGGLDSRALITDGYGDRVAALVTVATPHAGTPVADVILGVVPGFAEREVAGLVDALAGLLDGTRQDALAAAQALSTEGCRAFEARNPDDPRVAYFSLRGRTSVDPLFFLHDRDYCDAPLLPTYALLAALDKKSDGLVPLESQHRGEDLGTIPADHFNVVGHPLGVGLAFDLDTTWRRIARTLTERGF